MHWAQAHTEWGLLGAIMADLDRLMCIKESGPAMGMDIDGKAGAVRNLLAVSLLNDHMAIFKPQSFILPTPYLWCCHTTTHR